MSEATVLAAALEAHFVAPDQPTSGLVLREVTAPGSHRRIDLLAVSLWASRGWGIDAVEIKTDRRDFQREIFQPEKADPWWRHSNRFWIAAPSTTVANPDELPPGWGLLIPGRGRRFKIVVKAADRPLDVGMPLVAAILGRHVTVAHDRTRRAVDDARDAERATHREAVRQLREDLMTATDPEVRRALDKIRAVEEAAGIKLSDWGWRDDVTPAELGRAIRRYVDQERAGETYDRKLVDLLRQLRGAASWMTSAADRLAAGQDPETP